MINIESDSIERIAKDIHNADKDANIFEIEKRLSNLLAYSKLKVHEVQEQIEDIKDASSQLKNYNEATSHIIDETKKAIESVSNISKDK